MNPVQWLFFLATVGISAGIAVYGFWIKWKYSLSGFAASITGAEVARGVLDKMGMVHVSVTPVASPATPDEHLSGEGFFIPRRIYDGRDLPSLVQAARHAFLKGQLSNLTFWYLLKRKMIFIARISVILGWIFFLAGMSFEGLRFLIGAGLGLFTVVMAFVFFDLSFELEREEKTSAILAVSGCLKPHELTCFRKLNQAAALEGLACLILFPISPVIAFSQRGRRHGI
ncbi:MAG: putative neutral zinc metallopeptidase [Candidatus Omnitrophica bacterium ADurb.Bin277]|nr:MAG: putative neutral zinc metallopeptidase [Candidatus Omnitrophica bacterium ADurb.Bin277]